MMANGKITNKKDTEPTHTQTAVVTKAIGKIAKLKVKEPKHTQAAVVTKVN